METSTTLWRLSWRNWEESLYMLATHLDIHSKCLGLPPCRCHTGPDSSSNGTSCFCKNWAWCTHSV